MYLRRWWPQLDAAWYTVPAVAALLLLAQARLGWGALQPQAAAPAD